MGRLADIADARRYETVLLGDVQAHVLAQEDKPDGRRQDIIHPSEMAKADWCPRQTYYRIAGYLPTNPNARTVGFQLRSIFDEGNAIHSKWQGWLGEMGLLFGKWRCPHCDFTEAWSAGGECPQCQHRLAYREVSLEAPEYLIAGHADGAIPRKNCLIEVKSIGLGTLRIEEPGLLAKYAAQTIDGRTIYDLEALWKGLRRPLASHIRQAMVYLRLCREMGLSFDSMVFLYEFKFNQAFKEFHVKYSPSVADPLFEDALDIRDALATERPPQRPYERDSKPCKECPFLGTCWSDDTSRAPSQDLAPRHLVPRQHTGRAAGSSGDPTAGAVRSL